MLQRKVSRVGRQRMTVLGRVVTAGGQAGEAALCEGAGHRAGSLGKSIPGRGNSRCRSPEARMLSRNNETRVTRAE